MTRFNNRCLLFPLPELVFFPHSVLPLHIFEPRYRQMTEDALAGDRLVTMVQIRPVPPGSTWTEPVPIMDVGSFHGAELRAPLCSHARRRTGVPSVSGAMDGG
ncbi:MAG: LON peptidase substrate-binding domain-containing protein [Isosphaeraceae bacterium]